MAANETLQLDGLALNDGTTFTLEALEMPVPSKRAEWITGADADGAALVRDPLVENREITARIRVEPQADMDTALAKIGLIVDKLEESERQPDGLALVWTPADATKSVTFYVLSGEINDLPISIESGWFVRAPVVAVRMVCKPFGYGAEVTGSTATASTPIVTVTQASVSGDVPAEGRLVVTDMATQSRRHVEWGLQYRYYDAATALQINKADMTALGATSGTVAGSYNANVWSLVCTTSVGGLAATGNLGHVGTFRVKARVYGLSGHRVRLTWQDGAGPFRSNAYASLPAENVWSEVDLGIISVSPAALGTQRWTGRIEAYSTTAGDTIHLDYLVLIPAAEGYGKASAAFQYVAGSLVGRDEFTSIAAGTALNGRTAPAGGTWDSTWTGEAATDFAAADGVTSDMTAEAESRSTTSDTGKGRYAVLGSTNYTDTEVQVRVQRSATPGSGADGLRQGVLARWADSSNYLVAYLNPGGNTTQDPSRLKVAKVVAGVETTLNTALVVDGGNGAWTYVNVVVYATGRWIASLLDNNGSILATIEGFDSAVATGGALATGKPGFTDYWPASSPAITRYYDDFQAWTPAAEPIVVYSGRKAEFRHDDQLRQDSTGTYYGMVPSYRGSRFLLPPAGDEGRTSRILVKARRNNNDVADDTTVNDSTKVEVFYRPRYLVVPR